MSEINSHIETEILTPGKILGAGREAKKLSQADVAKQLLMSKQTIIDLENDNYSKIVAAVYAKGYLKAYAHMLGMSVEPILEAFEKLGVYKKIPEANTKLQTVAENKKAFYPTHSKRWISYILFVLVIAMLIIWAAGRNSPINNAESETGKAAVDSVAVKITPSNDQTIKNSSDANDTLTNKTVAAEVILPEENSVKSEVKPALSKSESKK